MGTQAPTSHLRFSRWRGKPDASIVRYVNPSDILLNLASKWMSGQLYVPAILTEDTECWYSFNSTPKADSHVAHRAQDVPLIHTCHAAPLPCSDSAKSFVKVCVVARNIRTASPTV